MAAGEAPMKGVAGVTFVRENGEWRFHAIQSDFGGTVKKVEKNLPSGDLSFLKEGDFVPPATPPVAPPLCAEPDYVATYSLTSYGYEARLQINGQDCATVAGKSKSSLLIGGLRKGKNTVKLTVQPTQGSELKSVEMSLTARSDGGKSKKVVSYKADDQAKDFAKEFEIGDADFE